MLFIFYSYPYKYLFERGSWDTEYEDFLNDYRDGYRLCGQVLLVLVFHSIRLYHNIHTYVV